MCMAQCCKVDLWLVAVPTDNRRALGYISNGKPERVLDLFERMPLEPDAVILTILFNACGELSTERAKQRGKGVLAHLPQAFRDDSMLMNSAIDMLMKFGDVADAEQVFQSVTVRTKFMCGTMMKGKTTDSDLP